MTYFEKTGVDLQKEAPSVESANKCMQYSCRLCTERGKKIFCNMCAIREAHEIRVCALKELEESEEAWRAALAKGRGETAVTDEGPGYIYRTDGRTSVLRSI